MALLDSNNKVNTIYLTFARELGLPIRSIDIGAQKIDDIILDTFRIVVIDFLVIDKVNRVRFFEKTFLVANGSPKIVLGILFFTLSDVDVDFLSPKLRWKIYITEKAFPTTRHVKLVDKKEFAVVALDLESEPFVIHVASLSSNLLPSSSPLGFDIYPSQKPQTSDIIAEKAPTKVSTK